MVRRLKSDLLDMGVPGYPRRSIVQIDLRHEGERWRQTRTVDGQPGAPGEIGTGEIGTGTDAEIRLAALLAQYAEILKARSKRSRLVLVNLQKRLLSSVESFFRTLSVHARSLTAPRPAPSGAASVAPGPSDDEDGEYGIDDEAALAQLDLQIASASRDLDAPSTSARALLDQMLTLAEQTRREPGPKVLALLDWIRANQCAAVRIGGAIAASGGKKKGGKGAATIWSERRVIVFTEYADTKRILREILTAAFDGTDRGEERILEMQGGMSDKQRAQVQRAFNGAPDKHPVRVLLATDAAREGVNLQGHCADLFHFDVPWNPSALFAPRDAASKRRR